MSQGVMIVTCNKCRYSEPAVKFDLINDKYVCPQCSSFDVSECAEEMISIPMSQFLQDQYLMLHYSVRLENARNLLNAKDTALTILSEYVEESLEAFEEIFRSHDGAFGPEKMAKYIVAASYMQTRFGRKSMIKEVEAKLRSLSI